MAHDEWVSKRVAYIDGLKKPSPAQQLLTMLFKQPTRTPDQDRKLAALIRAEKAAEKASEARAEVARLLNAEKRAEAEAVRKARNHEMYQSAGLMSLAGLLDSSTGKPSMDRGELIGALVAITKVSADDQRRAEWKRQGDAILKAAEAK